MQLGYVKTRRQQIGQGATALFLFVCLAFSSPARAETIGLSGLMGMPSFVNLAIAIGNVNRAMRDAAENPMDKWRRQNVRSAISALPAAIIGLANDFKAGKLHDKDLPTVQGILGGFVDVNAADSYQKFLQNPSKELIPDLGSGFPEEYANGGSGGSGPRAVASNNRGEFDGKLGAPGRGPSIGFNDSAQRPSPSSAAAQASGQKDQAVASAENRAKELDRISVGFNDAAKKGQSKPFAALQGNAGGSSGSSASSGSASSAATSGGLDGGEPVSETFSLTKDPLEDRVRRRRQNGVVIRRAQGAPENALEADFFERVQKGQNGRDGKTSEESDRLLRTLRSGNNAPATSAVTPRNYQLEVKPKYWKIAPFLRLTESLILTPAHAQCQGGQCGEEGGGGGGGGGGEAAAQALFGVAAIISAIAPMVVAGIQASADKAIAKTNAQAQIKMTEITSSTSKFLSNQQKEIALTQTAASQQIAAENNARVTQRLELQLAELRAAREDQAKREREKIAIEQDLNKQRIELANKQADDNLLLAKQTLNKQLTQAGLSTGFANSRNSGSRLQIGRSNTAARTTNSVADGSTGDAIANSGAQNQQLITDGSQTAFRASNGNQVARAGGASVPGSSLGISRGVTDKNTKNSGADSGAGRNRLLSSATNRAFYGANGQQLIVDEVTGKVMTLDDYEKLLKKRGKKPNVSARVATTGGSTSSRGISNRRTGRGVTTMDREVVELLRGQSAVRGTGPSTNRAENRISSQRETSQVASDGSGSSDLSKIISSADSNFAAYQRRRASSSNVAAQPTPSGGHSGNVSNGRGVTGLTPSKNAYKPPSPKAYSTAIGK